MYNKNLEYIHENSIVLTIDLEDWFHCMDEDPLNWCRYERRIEEETLKLLTLFEKYSAHATFFVLGDVAKNHPELIKLISDKGHEIGSHSLEHRFIYNQNADEFRYDLKRSLDLLTSITTKKILSFRAPYFSIIKKSLWAFDILAEEGIVYDSSVFPVVNHRYGIPDFPRFPMKLKNGLIEFPITTYKNFIGNIPFAGGVYFRFYPYSVSNWFIHNTLKQNYPVILYFHPWEFDYEQPKINSGSKFLNFRHYYGLRKNFEKLNSVLAEYKVVTLQECMEDIL